VRWLRTICLICLCVSASWAQQQEPSLVDRLLRPNMELQNNAQGKKFVAGSAVIEHRGSVGTFLLRPNRAEKSFVNTHALTTTEYPSRSVGTEPRISSTQNRTANIPEPVGTSSVRDIHSANNPHNVTASRIFVDQHQFRDQGKSQKSLDRQNPPMTIDQVRDLLNKNK
jgi:hypothetical protein